MQRATPPSRPPLGEEQADPVRVSRDAALRHPRGRLAPPLAKDAPLGQRIIRTAHRLGHGLALHDMLLAAPAMAFHFFLSLLPLLVFVGYVVGLIARRRGVETVLSPLLDNLPATAEVVVKKEVERLAGAGGETLGPVAAGTFLWIASGGTHGLINAVENVVGAPRRAWWKKRVLSLAWVVTSLGAFALAAVAIVQWDAVVHASPSASVTRSVAPSLASASRRTHAAAGASVARAEATDTSSPESPRRRRSRIVRSRGERALALSLTVLFATAVLAAFYRFSVSHSKRVKRRVLPGAVLAVVVWMVISWAFGLYVSTLAEYAVFYGSLAAVAVLLVWLWLTSLAILVGAELNSQLEGLRD
jgi:membrane protein